MTQRNFKPLPFVNIMMYNMAGKGLSISILSTLTFTLGFQISVVGELSAIY